MCKRRACACKPHRASIFPLPIMSAELSSSGAWLRLNLRCGCESLSSDWKVNIFTDGVVCWDLLAIFALLTQREKEGIRMCDELRRLRDEWRVWCMRIPLLHDRMLPLSRRQVQRAQQVDDWAQQHATQDLSITTQCLLLNLAMWATQRKTLVCRRRAREMLLSVLATCVGSDELDRLRRSPVPAHMADRCVDRNFMDASCTHLQEALAVEQEGDNEQRMASILATLGGHYLHCGACCAYLALLVRQLSRIIDSNCCDEERSPWLERQARYAAERVERRKRGREVDREYRRQLLVQARHERKLHGSAAMASLDGIPSSTVHGWYHDDMAAQTRANWRVFKPAHGVFILTSDGARLGQPAKEMLHSTLKCMSEYVACVLAPQAP